MALTALALAGVIAMTVVGATRGSAPAVASDPTKEPVAHATPTEASATPTAEEEAEAAAAVTITVGNGGAVTWSFTVPAGATFSYSEVRWRTTGTESLNDWSGKKNQVFYSASANSYQIPNLLPGTRYKAKVFVEVTSGGKKQYLKSPTIRFANPDMAVTNTGLVTWSFEVPAGATFSYSEVRWRTTANEDLNDWSGKLNKVFWSASASSYQIPNLVEGKRYKAKVFVEVRKADGTLQYLKSQTIRFPPPPPATFRYNNLDTTGAVSTAGSYAFMKKASGSGANAEANTVVTTYEDLRNGNTEKLKIHETDADGASLASFYANAEVGDIFEWRERDDCWVRYKVTSVPSTAAAGVKQLGVEWMTYAFTGCSGAITATTAFTVDPGPLPDLGGASLTVPVVHGIYQIVPAGWTGTTKDMDVHKPPFYSGEEYTTDITVARKLDYWREPTVPEGWVLGEANSGGYAGPTPGYCAMFLTEERSYDGTIQRFSALEICGYFAHTRLDLDDASWLNGSSVGETRVIAGRPAYVTYSPPGPNHNPFAAMRVWVYDAATETEYRLLGKDGSLSGGPPDPLIAIAASLFGEQ